MDRSDGELVEALRRGDRAAFEVAFERYRARVYGFLVRLCSNPSLAEDLTQETFVRLASNAARLSGDTQLRAWLFTVARNRFVDHRRRQVIDFERLRELSLWPTKRSATHFESVAATDDQRRLERALGDLPLLYREVILLVGVEGFSSADAASTLGIGSDALRQRLARARRLLREALERS